MGILDHTKKSVVKRYGCTENVKTSFLHKQKLFYANHDNLRYTWTDQFDPVSTTGTLQKRMFHIPFSLLLIHRYFSGLEIFL